MEQPPDRSAQVIERAPWRSALATSNTPGARRGTHPTRKRRRPKGAKENFPSEILQEDRQRRSDNKALETLCKIASTASWFSPGHTGPSLNFYPVGSLLEPRGSLSASSGLLELGTNSLNSRGRDYRSDDHVFSREGISKIRVHGGEFFVHERPLYKYIRCG